jgi:hypothetical protein
VQTRAEREEREREAETEFIRKGKLQKQREDAAMARLNAQSNIEVIQGVPYIFDAQGNGRPLFGTNEKLERISVNEAGKQIAVLRDITTNRTRQQVVGEELFQPSGTGAGQARLTRNDAISQVGDIASAIQKGDLFEPETITAAIAQLQRVMASNPDLSSEIVPLISYLSNQLAGGGGVAQPTTGGLPRRTYNPTTGRIE